MFAAMLIVVGLLALTIGAEALVRGASGFAARLGVPAMVIGLTIVAFGTSSPELAVSVMAATRGESDIAVGNVVGSNIFNILVILGLSAVIAPLNVARRFVRLDMPLVIGASAALWVLALDGVVGRFESAVLVAALAAYTGWSIRWARRNRVAVEANAPGEPEGTTRRQPMWLQVFLILLGLGLCVAGSTWFVDGSVLVARAMGVSELVIGLTIVAVGTSLPELATSVVATFRGERDIAVGNVVGSNLFNILGVLGISGVVSPPSVAEQALILDIPVMIAVAVLCIPVFLTGARVCRKEAVIFLALYAAYVAYLVLAGTGMLPSVG